MELRADDAGFVRAPAPLVYRRLADVGSWPTWDMASRARPDGPVASHRWAIELRGAHGRRLRMHARFHGWRRDRGVLAAVHGDLDGTVEFWLDPTHGGTVVHALLHADTVHASPARVLADHRRAVRRGLWGLKDLLHLEARTSAGLLP